MAWLFIHLSHMQLGQYRFLFHMVHIATRLSGLIALACACNRVRR